MYQKAKRADQKIQRQRHREVSDQLKKVNEDIIGLKVEIEEIKRIEEYQKFEIQNKINECTKLEQEVATLIATLRADLEKVRAHKERFKISSTMIDVLILSQNPTKDKGGLGLKEGQRSKTKPIYKKVDNQRKPQRNAYQSKDLRIKIKRISIQQLNAQRYPSFNGFCYSCNQFRHKPT